MAERQIYDRLTDPGTHFAPSIAQKERYFPTDAIMQRKLTKNTVLWLTTVPAERDVVAFSVFAKQTRTQLSPLPPGRVGKARLCSVLGRICLMKARFYLSGAEFPLFRH